MDWIKIRTGHILGTTLTKMEISGLVLMQLMTAHFERIPTDEERRREVSDDLLSKVRAALERSSTTLQEVLDEVLKDCQRVLDRRSIDTAKKQKWRHKRIKEGMSEGMSTGQVEKIREDKSRKMTSTSLTLHPDKAKEHISNAINSLTKEVPF